jgi:hypothetical protein
VDGIFVIKRVTTADPPVELILADGTLEGPLCVDGPRVSAKAELEPVPGLFARRPTIFDRLGSTTQVSFTIAREHPSGTRAFHHTARQFERVRGVAHLVIELTEAGITTQWRGARAGWESVETPGPDGVSTWTTYRLLVPELVCTTLDADGRPALTNTDGDPMENTDGDPMANP